MIHKNWAFVRTYALSAKDIRKDWFLIDAKDVVVGRLASFLADRLRGKHKPIFSPHLDCGDCFIVVNADKVHLTGKNKLDQRIFYQYTGYPGGLKERTAKTVLRSAHPERVLEAAVRRMIDQGPLRRQQLLHLFVYAGETHPHAAQQPKVLDFGSLHRCNSRNR